MAIIEIAKIQVRRGRANQTNLPQLDAGEFGWATDIQELYIGNGNTEQEGDQAPEVGNTRILTQRDLENNIFLLNTTYTYQGNDRSPSSPVLTGLGGTASYIGRSVQNKLDDIISIADFGVTGNSTQIYVDTSSTITVSQQIQQAIDQIYLTNKTDQRSRKKLYFPAGDYVITATLYVPPYANIYGEGIDKTQFRLITSSTALIQFVDGSSTPGAYVKYEDGQINIQSTTNPREIEIEGITFKYDPSLTSVLATIHYPLLRADCVYDSSIKNCKFLGSINTAIDSTNYPDTYVGIDIRSQGSAISTDNLKIVDCEFEKVKSGIRSNYDCSNITIENNKFYSLVKGVNYGDSLAASNPRGPFRTKILNNKFEYIKNEGIFVGDTTNDILYHGEHVSAYNTFKAVGDNLINFGDSTVTSAVITFRSKGNVSIEDKFYRDFYMNLDGIPSTINYLPSVDGSTVVKSDQVFEKTPYSTAYIGGSASTLFKLPYSGKNQTVKINYSIINSSSAFERKGELSIFVAGNATDPLGSLGTTSTIIDSYTETSGVSIPYTFSVNWNGSTATNTINIQYTNGEANIAQNLIDTRIRYQYSYSN